MSRWADDFKKLVQSDRSLEAYQLFIANKENLLLLKVSLSEEMLSLERSALNSEQLKDYLFYLIIVASKEHKIGKVEAVIDEYLENFITDTEPNKLQTIWLAKANAAGQNGKFNVAYNTYLQVIANENTAAIDLAYAYRGLYMITSDQKEKIKYGIASADKFLEAGQKKEAITDLAHLAGLVSTDSSKQSLDFIDQAITLFDTEDTLNKEQAAGLYQRKANYLVALGEQQAALVATEKSCALREGLVGNEHEQYASFSTALSLVKGLNDEAKIIYYEEKIAEVEPLIQNEEFYLQQLVGAEMQAKRKVDGSLMDQINASALPFLQFGTYLYNSLLDDFSFEAKLEWLDKAKLLLDPKIFENHHYSLLYYNLAEAYRKNNLFDEAIKNYELSLTYNPFNWSAIQNCSYTLTRGKHWQQAKAFFSAQIQKMGERPGLEYGLARAYFELKEYQSAFNLFRKIKGKVNADVTPYINKCLDDCESLDLQPAKEIIPEPGPPISLDMFKAALKAFARSIATNTRMHFWQMDNGEYKWKSKPEEMAKQHLITALEMKFEKDGIDIIQERPAGAGIIDLYILLRGGLKIVVEIKICGGSGYSSTYAISGEDQLVHYIKNTQTHIGFLVVFDGRINQFGQGFQEVRSLENLTLYTVAVEMSPKVPKRSAKPKAS